MIFDESAQQIFKDYEAGVINYDEHQKQIRELRQKDISDHVATPLRRWVWRHHEGNITHAASALGVDRSTLHRVMDTAYVINGRLYTIKRKAS